MGTKWEYKFDSYEPVHGSNYESCLKDKLNELGEDGWELASMTERISGEEIGEFFLVLKRPKP